MKIYLAFRFTGEDLNVLNEEISQITHAILESGNQVFCSLDLEHYYMDHHFTGKEIVEYSLNQLNSCDALLAYIKSPEKSEGMLMEIGFAIAKKKDVYLLMKEGVQTNYVHAIAKKHETFSSSYDIAQKTAELFA